MKKYLFIAALVLSLFSCIGGGEGKRESREDLRLELAQRDSLLNQVFESLNEITVNLETIKEREGVITSGIESGEIKKEPTARISEDIFAIDELLRSNREALASIQKQADRLRKANARIPGLEKLIVELTNTVEQKNLEINGLKEELRRKDIVIEDLSAALTGLAVAADSIAGKAQTAIDLLYTGYYFVGPQKELLDKGIVYKSGSIGRTLKVKENVDLKGFTQVDVRDFDKIIINQKKVELVSTHPEKSYEIYTDGDGVVHMILITDKERFWEYSKVLVVSYK